MTVEIDIESLLQDNVRGLIADLNAHLLKLKTEGKVQGSGFKSAWSLAG